MQHMPQKTWVAIISDHVDRWRRATGMSREAVAEMIISEYQRINKARLPGIKDFSNDKTQDIDTNFEARRVNADRIFRWLDDRTKDSTLLPTNFIPSILLAMPDDHRINCVNELFMQIGFCAQVLQREVLDKEKTALNHLQSIMKEGSEAELAVSRLVAEETLDDLVKAEKEIAESVEKLDQAHKYVTAKIAEKLWKRKQSSDGGKHDEQERT
ncbi:hypothetical protein [Nitrosomonas marina]|uniref:Uncharacterized protein n=1 Tax=Nitrosomonas marina TaxID=917 RepID=A0A1H8JC04_9PROT|nr:hypothetical protein [Nitrosomonas marina]SEN77717.1 hypothetical protein SAMN05216325_1651 [Nitrosomonas marina]